MRNIPEGSLAKLAQRHGTEPICIIEVDWVRGGRTLRYADRDVAGIPGRIVGLGDLDNVINVSDNNNSQSLSLTLDDADGSIKAIFDAGDIHKRDVRVYQWFDGLDLADKFLLFSGKISSPVTWSERDRTIKFTILSQLEDKEIGFSAEEGQFPYLPADLVGKPWPMIFGLVQDVPALQVNQAVTGTTLTPCGILSGQWLHDSLALYEDGSDSDSGSAVSGAQMSAQLHMLDRALKCWAWVDPEKAGDIQRQITDLQRQRTQQATQASNQAYCARLRRQQQLQRANEKGLGSNPIQILGGEDFPQNTPLTLDIGGGLFTGHMVGTAFHVSTRVHPEDEARVEVIEEEQLDPCPQQGGGGKFYYEMEVPCGCPQGDFFNKCIVSEKGFIISTPYASSTKSTQQVIQQFWADAGATVRVYSNEPITYIVSIVPGTVIAVKAYKQFDGVRRLVDVPGNLYRVETKTYGAVTAVQLVVNKPLSAIQDQGWSDDVYVTFQSSVGPDTIDILTYLIQRYTDLSCDSESFEYVRTKLASFPANFPILERKNTLTVLQEIAYQARCALWLADGVFHIKYLPEEPAAVDAIAVSDIDAESGVEVELTNTEDLITKLKVQWRVSWAPGSTDRPQDRSEKWMILRHNIARYGTHEEERDWYIYNQPDTVLKCATFWLIRKSHTWKRIKFKTFLNKLNLETFDCVTLDFAGRYVANGPVKAIVQKANYNSTDNLIDFECLVPVKAGTMEQFKFYWPSQLTIDETWPPQADIDSGDAGGGGVGAGATGQLPIGYMTDVEDGGVVWVGGPNVIFRAQSDRGDRRPTDVGYTSQTIVSASVYGEMLAMAKPQLDLTPYYLRPTPVQSSAWMDGYATLDIQKTRVFDSDLGDGSPIVYLKDVFKVSGETESLVIDGSQACIVTDEHPTPTPFDFRYDEEGEVFGAGTAFLKD